MGLVCRKLHWILLALAVLRLCRHFDLSIWFHDARSACLNETGVASSATFVAELVSISWKAQGSEAKIVRRRHVASGVGVRL